MSEDRDDPGDEGRFQYDFLDNKYCLMGPPCDITSPMSDSGDPALRPASIADVLRRAIVDQGYTAYALGRQTGVAPHVISKFLAGERGLNLETLERLASHLNLRLVERAPAESDSAESVPPA